VTVSGVSNHSPSFVRGSFPNIRTVHVPSYRLHATTIPPLPLCTARSPSSPITATVSPRRNTGGEVSCRPPGSNSARSLSLSLRSCSVRCAAGPSSFFRAAAAFSFSMRVMLRASAHCWRQSTTLPRTMARLASTPTGVISDWEEKR